MGVARRWSRRQGKVDNCQVRRVRGPRAWASRAALTDVRLYLPKEWVADPERCTLAGVPEAQRQLRTKSRLALEISAPVETGAGGVLRLGRGRWRLRQGARIPARAAGDGRGLCGRCAQGPRVYLEDPPGHRLRRRRPERRGRPRSRLEAQSTPQRVDEWVTGLPQDASQRIQPASTAPAGDSTSR